MTRRITAPTGTPPVSATDRRLAHTPGPWTAQELAPAMPGAWEVRGGEGSPEGPELLARLWPLKRVVSSQPWVAANARLIAAAPDLYAELLATADWLDERAHILLAEADRKPAAAGDRKQRLRDESARFKGRACVVRQLLVKVVE